jgi:hypothetical protein
VITFTAKNVKGNGYSCLIDRQFSVGQPSRAKEWTLVEICSCPQCNLATTGGKGEKWRQFVNLTITGNKMVRNIISTEGRDAPLSPKITYHRCGR